MDHLEKAFLEAKKAYPDRWISGYRTVWISSLFDDMEGEEAEVPHTWQLVDAAAASFRWPDRIGMLVLQERYPGGRLPANHWGYMIAKSELQKQERA